MTAPSAVHLTTCFSPDSQHHRLSVEASLPLSPLQRFSLLNYLHYITPNMFCQYIFCYIDLGNLRREREDHFGEIFDIRLLIDNNGQQINIFARPIAEHRRSDKVILFIKDKSDMLVRLILIEPRHCLADRCFLCTVKLGLCFCLMK